jgi:hypothetical protein
MIWSGVAELPDVFQRAADHSRGRQGNLLDGQSRRQPWRHGNLLRHWALNRARSPGSRQWR